MHGDGLHPEKIAQIIREKGGNAKWTQCQGSGQFSDHEGRLGGINDQGAYSEDPSSFLALVARSERVEERQDGTLCVVGDTDASLSSLMTLLTAD